MREPRRYRRGKQAGEYIDKASGAHVLAEQTTVDGISFWLVIDIEANAGGIMSSDTFAARYGMPR